MGSRDGCLYDTDAATETEGVDEIERFLWAEVAVGPEGVVGRGEDERCRVPRVGDDLV